MILYYHELVLGYIENPPVHRLGTGGYLYVSRKNLGVLAYWMVTFSLMSSEDAPKSNSIFPSWLLKHCWVSSQ